MRSVVVFSVFSALAFGAATAAIADGAPVSLTPAPTVRDGWSGLYIGIGGGAGNVDRSGSNDKHVWQKKEKCKDSHPAPLAFAPAPACTTWEPVDYGSFSHVFSNPFGEDDWKGFGTVQVGYDRLVHDRILIGAFADVDIYAGDEDNSKSGWIKDSFEINHTWNVGGKLGFLATPKFVLYGVGGYTQASINKSVTFGYWPTLNDFDSPKGWFAGGGAEIKLRAGVSLKGEYRYADYDSLSDGKSYEWGPYGNNYCRVSGGKSWTAEEDLTIQSVRALLVFRLDEPDPPVALK